MNSFSFVYTQPFKNDISCVLYERINDFHYDGSPFGATYMATHKILCSDPDEFIMEERQPTTEAGEHLKLSAL